MDEGRGELLESEASARHGNLHVSERRVDGSAGADAAKDLAADGAGSWRRR